MGEELGAAPESLSGATFGKYRLLKRLAVGGMAEVHLANLTGAAGFNKLLVVKLVLPKFSDDPQFVGMFLDEARLAARLSHVNIAQTFELGESNGRYFIAMEYVMGEPLSALLRRASAAKTQLSLQCSLRIVEQLLDALEYAHDATDDSGAPLGLVHRDVTPSNVMVTYHGAVKLVDFGIARTQTQRRWTREGVVKGKAGFMSPEQCCGEVLDRRSDIFSTGALLYTLAAWREPYPRLQNFGDILVLMRDAVFPRPREVNPDVPPQLEEIILRAMKRDPTERYGTAAEMSADLQRFVGTVHPLPSSRHLAETVRGLFPDRARLAQLKPEEPADPKTLVEMLDDSGAGSSDWEPSGLEMDSSGRLVGEKKGQTSPLPDEAAPKETSTSSPTSEWDEPPPLAAVREAPAAVPPLPPARPSGTVGAVSALLFVLLLSGTALWRGPALWREVTHRLLNPPAVLSVNTQPSGAAIRIDGADLGETPLLMDNFYPRGQSVKLEIVLKGYRSWTGTFRGGEAARFEVTLERR
jgi:serine/threonine protein kinase